MRVKNSFRFYFPKSKLSNVTLRSKIEDTLAFHHMVGALLPASGGFVGKCLIIFYRIDLVWLPLLLLLLTMMSLGTKKNNQIYHLTPTHLIYLYYLVIFKSDILPRGRCESGRNSIGQCTNFIFLIAIWCLCSKCVAN